MVLVRRDSLAASMFDYASSAGSIPHDLLRRQ